MDERKLVKIGAAAVFAIAVLAAVGILTGSVELGSTITLSDHAVLVGGVALAAGAAVGDRPLDDLESWEWLAVGVAVTLLTSIHLGQPQIVIDLLNDYAPWSGLTAAAIAYLGFWRVAGVR